MFAGHAATGLLLGARSSARGLALLVGASLAADVGWCLLTLAGVEGGRSLGSQAFHAPRLPWSHSLASTAVLAVAAAGLGAALGGTRLALLAAGAVGLHWVVGDVPFGEGFPLLPWTAPVPGPHLYATWPAAFVLESALLALALAVVPRARRWSLRRALALSVALVGLHLASWAPSFAATPPVDLDREPAAIVAYLALLVAAWAACAVAAVGDRA